MRFSISHVMAGATAVFVGYSSAAVLILEAVKTLNGSAAMQSSWLLAVGLAMGLSSILLSWHYKAPILTAWSTPGVALLIVALTGASAAEAVGIFVFSSALIVLCGMSGVSDRLLRYIPPDIAAAILGGILLKFVVALVPALANQPILIGTLIAVYFGMRKLTPRLVFFWVLLVAIGLPVLMGQFNASALTVSAPAWVWVWPDFDLSLMLGVGVPLFVVTMVSQNLPGIMMLRSNGYAPPASPLLKVTGLFGLLFAPLGAFAINLAAITAAICQTAEADPDPAQRYKASISAGGVYIVFGLAGSLIVGLFMALPPEVTSALAGLALLPVITANFRQAFGQPETVPSSVVAFIVTVSDVNFFGVNSSFWGLVVGLTGYYVMKRSSKNNVQQ